MYWSWNDEDRPAGQQFPDGHTDGFVYNGLGLRLRKSDPTSNYSYPAGGDVP